MRFLIWAFVLLAAAALGFYYYMGGFQTIKVEDGQFGPIEFVYATHKGPYADLNKSWDKFMAAWAEAKLKPCETMGVYLDKPDTAPEKLRSVIACRIDGWAEEDKAAARAAFPAFSMPQSQALLSSFPLRNVLSFFFAPMRVYPEMQKALAAKNAEAVVSLEFYGRPDNFSETKFVIPLGLDRAVFQPLYDAFPAQ